MSSTNTASISSQSTLSIRSLSSDVIVESGSTLSMASGTTMSMSSNGDASISSSGKMSMSATNIETVSSSSSRFHSGGLMSIESTNNHVKIKSSGGKATLFSNGNFGVGVDTANAKLHVGGNAIVEGALTATDYYSPSDRRLKKNIKPIKNALQKVLSLNGVTYSWNEKALSIKSKQFDGTRNKTHIGLIAQDVESVLPELVSTWSAVVSPKNVSSQFSKTTNGDDVPNDKDHVEEFKSVDYSKLSAVIIEAMREQRDMIAKL